MKGRGVSASNLARAYGHSVLASEVLKVGCAAVTASRTVVMTVTYAP